MTTLKRTKCDLTFKVAKDRTKDKRAYIRLPEWDSDTLVYRQGTKLYMERPFERIEWIPSKIEQRSKHWELWKSER